MGSSLMKPQGWLVIALVPVFIFGLAVALVWNNKPDGTKNKTLYSTLGFILAGLSAIGFLFAIFWYNESPKTKAMLDNEAKEQLRLQNSEAEWAAWSKNRNKQQFS